MITLNKVKQVYGWYLNKYRPVRDKLFGHREYRKVVVICQARTGSNLLLSLLGSHPNILFKGEIFDFLKGRSARSIWDNHFRKYPKKIKAVGFKIFYQHPYDGDQEVWDYIKKDNSILIIHLTRENIFRAYVSFHIAEKTKRWFENSNNKVLPKDKKVIIDIDDFCNYREETESNIKYTNNQFSNSHELLKLTYEELAANRQAVIDKIRMILDLPNFQLTTKMIRQNAESLQDLVINFEEISNYFKSKKEQEFLSETES